VPKIFHGGCVGGRFRLKSSPLGRPCFLGPQFSNPADGSARAPWLLTPHRDAVMAAAGDENKHADD
jgi:hypothetical protein